MYRSLPGQREMRCPIGIQLTAWTQPALVVPHSLHAYETPSCPPTYFAVTLSMYTLIPTVHRALLKSAVSGIGHWIHTTKKIGFARTTRPPRSWPRGHQNLKLCENDRKLIHLAGISQIGDESCQLPVHNIVPLGCDHMQPYCQLFTTNLQQTCDRNRLACYRSP